MEFPHYSELKFYRTLKELGCAVTHFFKVNASALLGVSISRNLDKKYIKNGRLLYCSSNTNTVEWS